MLEQCGVVLLGDNKACKVHDIDKWSKIGGLYILEGLSVFVHSSLASEDFQEKNELWDLRWMHDGCLEVISEQFNKLYIRQGIKIHLTIELSQSF